MTRHRTYLLATVLLSASVPMLHADSFTFSFSAGNNTSSGSGTLTGSAIPGTEADLITGITGFATTSLGGVTSPIASILQPGSFPTPTNGGSFPANDNTLFVVNGAGTFTQYGISFLLGNGAQVNLYNGAAGGNAFILPTNGISTSTPATITVVPAATTPEPTSLVLLGTGLLGCFRVLKRRIQ